MKIGHHRTIFDYYIEDLGFHDVVDSLNGLKEFTDMVDIDDVEEFRTDILEYINQVEEAIKTTIYKESHLVKLVNQEIKQKIKGDNYE